MKLLSFLRFPATYLAEAKVTGHHLGRICLLDSQTKNQDVVIVLPGCSIPLVLLPVRNRVSTYRLVGAVCVHGAMDGEPLSESSKRISTGDPDAYDDAFEEITLV